MKTSVAIFSVLTLAGLAIVVAGCQTYGEAAGLGAALGAGTGALVSHDKGTGALVGAGVGALSGLVAHDIKARRQRDAQATASEYHYQPTQGEVLNLEANSAMPAMVRPGNAVEGTVQYALLGSGPGGVDVQESRQLVRGGQVVGESSKTVRRADGTWVSTQQFRLPPDAPPGTYSIVQTIQTARSRISATSSFTVQ